MFFCLKCISGILSIKTGYVCIVSELMWCNLYGLCIPFIQKKERKGEKKVTAIETTSLCEHYQHYYKN